MMKYFILQILAAVCCFCWLDSEGYSADKRDTIKSANLLIDENATPETRNLYMNLKDLVGTGLMFGHMDDTAFGVGWWMESGRSDVKDVCGSYPAVIGWDINGVELGNPNRGIGFSFDQMREWIKDCYERGDVITISWHSANPVTGNGIWDKTPAVPHILPGGSHHETFKTFLDRVADYFSSLKTNGGKFIPIIFRPYHEHTTDAFWWGQSFSTAEEYKALWQFTVEYLKDVKGLHHLLYAYAPHDEGMYSVETYLERYPGDDFVDILGLDSNRYFRIGNYEEALRRIQIIVELAEAKEKIAALTELQLNMDNYSCWTDFLNSVKNDPTVNKISWILLWGNYGPEVWNYWTPYPGHQGVPDFINFYNDPFTIFENDLPDVYSSNSNEFSVSGNIYYYSNSNPIQNVDVTVKGNQTTSLVTAAGGDYQTTGLQGDQSHIIKATKPDDSDIGTFTVTVYDAALTAQAAIGVNQLTQDEAIAADVSKDGEIYTYDASLIAQYAIGLPKSPASHAGEWSFSPDSILIQTLSSDHINQNFSGIILGDVDGGWTQPPGQLGKKYTIKQYEKLKDILVNPGDEITIPLEIDLTVTHILGTGHWGKIYFLDRYVES